MFDGLHTVWLESEISKWDNLFACAGSVQPGSKHRRVCEVGRSLSHATGSFLVLIRKSDA
jgi:hypothetical protein